jgi:hypothetical protein
MLCTQSKQTTVLCVQTTLIRQLNPHNYRWRKLLHTVWEAQYTKEICAWLQLYMLTFDWTWIQDNLNRSTATRWYSEATFYWTPLEQMLHSLDEFCQEMISFLTHNMFQYYKYFVKANNWDRHQSVYYTAISIHM